MLAINGEIILSDLSAREVSEVYIRVLKAAGLVGELVRKVKVVKTGDITRAVTLKNINATAGAKAAIEAAGGSVQAS